MRGEERAGEGRSGKERDREKEMKRDEKKNQNSILISLYMLYAQDGSFTTNFISY